MNNIVFLHGFLGHPSEFKTVISSLPNFRSLAIDLSCSPDYTLYGLSQFVKSKLEESNIKKAHFWGYSMGGRVLLEFYRNYPDMCASLILESTSPGLVDPKEKSNRIKMDSDWANLIQTDSDLFLEKWYAQVLFRSFRKNKDFSSHLGLRREGLNIDVTKTVKMLMEASPGANLHHFDVLEIMKVPTLALVGQFDEKYVQIWSKLIDKNSNIAIKVIQNSGHVIHLEQPEIAAKEFEKFISPHLCHYKKGDVYEV